MREAASVSGTVESREVSSGVDACPGSNAAQPAGMGWVYVACAVLGELDNGSKILVGVIDTLITGATRVARQTDQQRTTNLANQWAFVAWGP